MQPSRAAVAFVASLLGVLAFSSVPASANVLDSASVTPTCSNYTVTVGGHLGNCPPLSVNYSFTLTPNSGPAIGPITGTVHSGNITIGPSPTFNFTGSATNPYPGGGLTGSFSFTLSGSATLISCGGTVTNNTVDISSTANLTCPPGTTPPLTWGFWKTHTSFWPVSTLTLGTVTYTKAQLINILGTPVGGDASINLAHQLIGAMLNLLNGSNPDSISATVSDANDDLGNGTIPQGVTARSTPTLYQDMVGDANALDNYNSSGP